MSGLAAMLSLSSLTAPRIPAINTRRPFGPSDRGSFSGPRINDRIRISPIRLIDENDQQIGVIDTDSALRRAREAGLDLVEISSTSSPPVCRIMDFGKWKYEQSKKDKANKSRSKTMELKEVRLGRSMKIDPHDVEIRIQQARRFLIEGHKVQIVQNFRGREVSHKGRGDLRMKEIIDRLSDIAKVEIPPRMAGRRMSVLFSPDRPKIEQIKRKEAAAAKTAAPKTADGPATKTAEPVPAGVPQTA